MKRSIEQNIQSAYNRHLFDILNNYSEVYNNTKLFEQFLSGVDKLIIASIKTYRKHKKSNKDLLKTNYSRLKRCNVV